MSISTSVVSIIYVPLGTACIECVFDSVLATDAEFQIDNRNIDDDDSIGRVDNGVLVVFDTENVFSNSSTRNIKCTSGGNMAQDIVLLASKSLLHICMFMSVGGITFKN